MAKVMLATTPQEKERIYQFRYRVYVEEMRKQPREANHSQKTLTDAFDDTAMLFYITQGEEIIATLRRNFLDSSPLSESLDRGLVISRFASAFPFSALSLSSRLMVAPAWRNLAMIGAIVLEAYREARIRGIQFDFLHAAPWLVPFYENLGYRRYTNHFLDPEVGLQIPQVLVLEDSQHLQAVRSPFARIAQSHANSPVAADWFCKTFLHSQPGGVVQLAADGSFVRDNLQHPRTELTAVFPGLNDESIQQLLQASAIHSVKSGDTIVRIGDVANAMFIILSGVIAVSHLSGQTTKAGLTLGPGQTFGEANLFHQSLSSEQAVALADADLLILPKPAIQKLMKTMPTAMCRILFNASHAICTRYVPDVSPPFTLTIESSNQQVA